MTDIRVLRAGQEATKDAMNTVAVLYQKNIEINRTAFVLELMRAHTLGIRTAEKIVDMVTRENYSYDEVMGVY